MEVTFDSIILLPDLHETFAFVYSVSLSDGSVLPDGISIDNTLTLVRIEMTDQELAGVYNVTVSATGSFGPVKGLVVNSSFELIVESSNSTAVRAIPYFKEGLDVQTAYVGESWLYTIPEATHQENLDITYDVDLLRSVIFVNYEAN